MSAGKRFYPGPPAPPKDYPYGSAVNPVWFRSVDYIVGEGENGFAVAVNGKTGASDFKGDATTTINWVLSHLSRGRTWVETVAVIDNYTINRTLTVYSFTYLEILGKISLADDSDCDMIYSESTTDVYIVNGELDGNRGEQAAGDIIRLNNVWYAWIIRVTISYAYRDGIFLDGAAGVGAIQFIIQNSISYCNDGIRGGGTDDTVMGNIIIANYARGINWSAVNGVLCNNICHHHDNGAGINTSYSSAMTIVGNNCQANQDGIQLAADSDDYVVCSNICKDNTRYGIYISAASCERNLVFNNKLLNNATAHFLDNGTGTILPTVILQFQHGGSVEGTVSAAEFISATASAKGWRVDGGVDWAVALGHLPNSVQQISKIKIWAIALGGPLGSPGQMHLEIVINAGADNLAFNTEPVALANFDSVTTDYIATDVVHWAADATDDADIGSMVGGMSIEVKVIYEAGSDPDGATNAVFRCVEIEYV